VQCRTYNACIAYGSRMKQLAQEIQANTGYESLHHHAYLPIQLMFTGNSRIDHLRKILGSQMPDRGPVKG